jgi:hypothetical protein
MGLEKLQSNRWEDMDEAKVQAIWPTKLLGEGDCDSSSCKSLVHDGRVIEDLPECAEIFNFDVERGAETSTEALNGIIIHYSTSRKTNTIAALKVMAKAIGVPQPDLDVIGTMSRQDFYWEIATDEICLLTVRVAHRDDVWTASLWISRRTK